MGKEAVLYEKMPDDKVKCTACARYCVIHKDQIGLCGIRVMKLVNCNYLFMVKL